ncbi:MAG: SCO family protein, partial [Gammaproteobacteria bacterium]
MRTIFSLLLALAWLAPAVSATPPETTGGAAATPAATTQADADEASRQYFTDLKLVTQDGKDVRFFSDVLQDRIVLINFIFTHCEGACPLMTRKLKSSRDLLDAPLR